MQYHHQVSGLSSIVSVAQYDYNDHVEAWFRNRIVVVGPNNYDHRLCMYIATIGDYDLDCTVGYGSSPQEAEAELMAQLGF